MILGIGMLIGLVVFDIIVGAVIIADEGEENEIDRR